MRVTALGMIVLMVLAGLGTGCKKEEKSKSPQQGLLSSAPAKNNSERKITEQLQSLKPAQGNLLMDNTLSPGMLYAEHCSACHGESLTGGSGPALARAGATHDEKKLLALILEGHPETTKPTLSASEAEQIARWLSHHK